MGWNDWFRNEKNEEKKIPRSLLLNYFNILAAITVILPFFMWMVAHVSHRAGKGGGDENAEGEAEEEDAEGEDNGNEEGEEQGAWWNWWSTGGEDQPEEERGQGSLVFVTVFVYIWSLLLFGAIVWYTNRIYRRDKQLKGVLASLLVFTNHSFLLLALMGGLGFKGEGEEMEDEMEDGGFMAQYPSAMLFTYFFWVIFGSVFSVIFYKKISQQDKDKWNALGFEYQKQDDATSAIQ